ncbi:hypothetical protein [Leptospira meyeri]|uniref:hypothetical protein n=1 Tax=Leptospira meyeri TaxID=29508 RepID=UPI000C2A4649|nr:hypothetical protein [Leptospira meyeri]PJZ98655.1 hypothetical protein CH358_07040 [Leptospira meyeri]
MKKLTSIITETEKILEEIKSIKNGDEHFVFGFDFYKYSEMTQDAIIAFPLLMHTIVEKTITKTIEDNPYLFQKYEDHANPFENFIDTGDGGFLILKNPLEAIAFILNFSIYLRVYNAYFDAQNLYDIIGEVNVRFAITKGNVYQFKQNYYGDAIIKCARILSKDKLNRFLIDYETHKWFLSNSLLTFFRTHFYAAFNSNSSGLT